MHTKNFLRLALLMVVVTVMPTLQAQIAKKSNIKLINSRQQISKAIEYHDDKEYAKAERMYAEIPKSDSLYAYALYERAMTCYTMEKYDSAVTYCLEGLTLNKTKANFYGLLGNVYDDMKQQKKAIAIFQEGLKQFPYNQLMHFNLGLVYYRLDSLDKAENELLQSLKLDPFHFKSHYYLGELNERKGRFIPALLCYYMAATISPKRTDAIAQLEKFLNGESTLVSLADKYPLKEEEQIAGFEQLEDIIKSKIALNPKFKTAVKINDIVVKQGQMFLDKLAYNSKVDNFYMNFAVRFLTSIRDKKLYEPYFYHLFTGYDNEEIQKWVKKKEKKYNSFIEEASQVIKDLRKVNLANLETATDTVFNLYDEDGNLNSFGHYSDKNKLTKEGRWTWIHANGGLEGVVNFVNGKEQGEIGIYNSEGIISSLSTKKEGIYEGPYKTYYENGVLEMESNMKNDKIDGPYKKYYTSGQLKEEGLVKEGKLNGIVKAYYIGGQLQYEMKYTNGLGDGPITKYFVDGKIKEKYTLVKDEASGEYLKYYPNGTLAKTGTYEKDKSVGKWKEFYANGTLQSEYTLNAKSENIDVQKDYYADGKLQFEANFNGSKNTSTYFGRSGKKYFKTNTEDGKLVSFEAYDADGKVIDKGETSAKTLNYRFRNEQGAVIREGKIVNGKYEGVWAYNNSRGNRMELRIFKNDELEGNDSVFWQNGTLRMVKPYKTGNLSGYYEEYFLNGSICKEGWYVDGSRQGMWKSYFINGAVNEVNYYANDDSQGWQEEYFPNGKLNQQSYYEFSHFAAKMLYDTLGNLYDKSNLVNGNGLYELKGMNGTVTLRGEMLGGMFNGKYQRFHPNGKSKTTANILSDEYYGKMETFTEDGQISIVKNYINDKLWGGYETYDNGKLEYTCNYINDNINGIARWVYPNGKSEIEYSYVDDDLDGPTTYYTPDGQVMFVVNFVNDVAMSYTYKSPSGSFVAPISVDKDTVHVVAYYSNGKKSADYYYYQGIKTGPYETFYPNGQTYIKYNRIGNEYQGVYSEFFQNGKINKMKTYYYGQLHGDSKIYYENGMLQSEETYFCDVKHGVAKYYDAKGKLTVSRRYHYGVLISETK